MTIVYNLADADWKRLKAAFRLCAGITRRAAGSFTYAFRFLPAVRRRGIQALYAFCRIGDDSVDMKSGDPRGRINRLRRALDLCYDGYYEDDFTLALADTVNRFDLERVHFDELISGIESDLDVKRYQTFEQLRRYCYRVAATVGLHCLKIFGADTRPARVYAENLGVAMQLTNILRDLREDFQRGRIYIPEEDLVKFGIEGERMFATENRGRLEELIRWEARRAGDFFRLADEAFPSPLRGRLFVARLIGAVYRELLGRIARCGLTDTRIELSRSDKLRIAYRCLHFNNYSEKLVPR